jgi:hypothetical protein
MAADRDTVRLHARRPVLGAPIGEHEMPYACADYEADDLRAARGTIAGIAGGVVCWLALAALIAVGVWAIELLAGV